LVRIHVSVAANSLRNDAHPHSSNSGFSISCRFTDYDVSFGIGICPRIVQFCMRWGLIPSWAKEASIGLKIDAMAETGSGEACISRKL
jgi:hypothetical protein